MGGSSLKGTGTNFFEDLFIFHSLEKRKVRFVHFLQAL